MRRCLVLPALGLAAAVQILQWQPSWAQAASKLPKIAVLSPGDETPNAMIVGLREGLTAAGYIDGRTVQIEYRWAQGRLDRLPALAAELASLNPDVLVALVTAASLAARAATEKLPIVMVGVADPVAVGLIHSLARPGGNVTGTATQQAEIAAKQVELTRQLDPGASRVSVLWNPANRAFQTLQLDQATLAARASGLVLHSSAASMPDEFETAFKKIADQGTRTLVILGDPLFTLHRRALIERATLARLVTICGTRDYSEAGCLLSYGPSYFEASKRAATYVRKILDGAQPGELPVEQPTKFDLIVNLKTAAALALTIPPTLLARADEVIE
jgi:putative ABC transport system substrate-binding protein